VTNWTLTNQTRRVEIPVGVAYDSDPERVMKLLVSVAKGIPDVMTEPEPLAVFRGFGDNAMDFELRFWAPFKSHVSIKSRVAVAIATALNEAGISIPFPQRDLRITLVEGELKDALKPPPEVPE
jgi:small-conductance mechanosensitive channel